jgi:hypothetical protein
MIRVRIFDGEISFLLIFLSQTFKDVAQLGRFTLRDEGKTIGILLRHPRNIKLSSFNCSHFFYSSFSYTWFVFSAMGKIVKLQDNDMVETADSGAAAP